MPHKNYARFLVIVFNLQPFLVIIKRLLRFVHVIFHRQCPYEVTQVTDDNEGAASAEEGDNIFTEIH